MPHRVQLVINTSFAQGYLMGKKRTSGSKLLEKARKRRTEISRKYPGVPLPSAEEIVSMMRQERAARRTKKRIKDSAERKNKEEEYSERDSLAQILREGRALDRKGWQSVWDRGFGFFYSYYGNTSGRMIKESMKATGINRVLFLGSGTGREAAEFAEANKGCEVHATVLAMVPGLRALQKKHRNLHFKVCHFGNMVKRLGEEKYSAVISMGATNRMMESMPIFDSVRKLLAKEGVAFLDSQENIHPAKLNQQWYVRWTNNYRHILSKR
jgi:hypothetical protein